MTAAAWALRLGLPPGLLSRQMVLMCVFNLLLHAKPSEPHLVPYLTDVKGFSNEQLMNDIFPVYTYTDFAFTILAAPASQVFGCKRCILAGAVCRLCTRFLLLWGRTLGAMQLMQVFYGAGVAAEIVFNAYVFTLVGPELYQSAASATAAASLLGFLIAAEAGQLAVGGGASLTSLFYASLVTVASGTLVCVALESDSPAAGDGAPSVVERLRKAASLLRGELRACYATPALRLLSAWWVAGALAGTYTENYGTNLFYAIDPSADANGHVTFVTRSLCCAAALAAIRAEAGAAAAGAWVYALGTAGAGVALAALAGAARVMSAYAAYAAVLTCLQFCTCVLYAQSAHALDEAADAAWGHAAGGAAAVECEAAAPEAHPHANADAAAAAPRRHGAPRGRAAVLFGANATAALALQTVVQAVAESSRAPPRKQFALLAGYCFLLAVATIAAGAALRSRSGTWRLVRERSPAVHPEDVDADGEQHVAGRELAPLLAGD